MGKNQVKSIKELLGDNKLFFADGDDIDKPIFDTSSSSKLFLARGHLSPDASFVYAFQQLATYYFINVAPQFQSFNAGNWVDLEDKARDVAIHKGKPLQVYQ